MRFRFIAGAWMMTIAIAAGAAVPPKPVQTPPARFQPYFAVRTIETQDKFGKALSSFYSLEERDASGRRLTARMDSQSPGGKLTQANITDPVKMRMIEINYVAHTATVTQFPAAAVDKLLPSSEPFAADDPNRSDLGMKALNGFDVHGYTWTVNDPNIGTDTVTAATPPPATTFSLASYPVVHEEWWSPVLQLFLLTTVRDGQGNKQIIRYDQIKVKEPTAEDFVIPAGFKVRTIELR